MKTRHPYGHYRGQHPYSPSSIAKTPLTNTLIQWISSGLMAIFLVAGCTPHSNTETLENRPVQQLSPPVTPQTSSTFGQITALSPANFSLSLAVGKGVNATIMVFKTDATTNGLAQSRKGERATVHYELRDGQPWITRIQPQRPPLAPGLSKISTIHLQNLLALATPSPALTLIDARSPALYNASHLPGALSIPAQTTSEIGSSLLPSDVKTPIIIYCQGPKCPQATRLATKLHDNGYQKIKVYLPGLSGWIQAGKPVYASTNTITRDDLILIDLRSPHKSEAGRIANSVTLSSINLLQDLLNIPQIAPIVLYGDSDHEVTTALAKLRKAGYKKITLVPGNYKGWLNSGGQPVSGPLTTAITWSKPTLNAEVTKRPFLSAAKASNEAVVLLDVRTPAETDAGAFSGAILLPLRQLSSHLSLLPQDKTIYVYSSTGARAELAARELNHNDFKARFLAATVNCLGVHCTVQE